MPFLLLLLLLLLLLKLSFHTSVSYLA